MNNREKLKKYYKEIYSPLIFVNEKKLPNNNIARIYLYNFKGEEEQNNFKRVFQGYLPYYVRNYDKIDNYELDGNIEEVLFKDAKKIWTNPALVPKRMTSQNGIFGELYNDYYIRNVINDDRLIAYTSKRDYKAGNTECTGIDSVACGINDNKLEIVLSEAKFLTTLSNAKIQLIEDIRGNEKKEKEPHVEKNCINSYMNFILERQAGINEERVKEINEKIRKLNSIMYEDDIKFIEAMNYLDYNIKFIFFAICQCTNRNIEHYKTHIDEIIEAFNIQVTSTGIKNYEIEIVLIPTFNTSMDLKNKMEEWD